ncbi:TLD-domain containing nucleolar protein [Abeliophyllum distichum]|uniref:TLD-domain containing nucleolar protein n=1 Tax=Abeliophyllum distichum TaxID=126358 RepID=A0ABD1V836_9LAMI
MGNTESSSTDPRLASASRAFTQNELEDLKSLFTSLAAQSQTDGKYVTLPVFKAYIGIDGPLVDRMFDLMTQKRKDQKLTFEDLVIAKGTYKKGTNDDIEEFIYQLLDINGDGIVGRSDLEAVLTAMLGKLFHKKYSKSRADSCDEIVDIFINASTFTKDDAESNMSFEDFRKWCSLLPSVRKFLGSLMMPSDPGSQIPQLLHQDNMDPSLILLRPEYAWHIGGALPQHELDEWKLLYHSSVHGQSFNTFLGNIQNGEGPTVLVIKDKEGYIYGGYASQPWARHADFYGDMKSFLFQLFPKASIFRPTGANHNLQWCAMNFTSESIPNGIGFGGRVNHFGLFLTANFDQGHTFECTTFGSPCLSKTPQIYPEVIECWGVVPHKAEKNRPEVIKGSVLERFKEDRHMLNMVGLANSSE